MPLVPSAADRRLLDEGRRTRAMVWMMAIMLFLTVLAAALGLGTWSAARLVEHQIAGRLTVQIVEADAAQRDAQAARALGVLTTDPAVVRATAVPHAELVRLLQPWLGADGDDPDLPVPALIDVDLRDATDASVQAVAARVQAAAPAAKIDRQARWMSPVARFMDGLIWLAAGLVALMVAATAIVVWLAARAGLDTHRDTIGVLHMLGSTDVQVARLFQRRIAIDTLLGGAVGTVAAMGVIWLARGAIADLGSEVLHGVTLGPANWVVLAVLPVVFALLATVAARRAVIGNLRSVL